MLTWLWRFPLGGMIVLETLGALNVVPVQPVFTDLGLILTAAAVWIAMELTKRDMRTFAVLPVITVTALDMAGDYLHFYATFEYYDAILHALGSAAAAAWVWSIVQKRYANRIPQKLLRWITFSGVVTAGVFYEIEEYLEDFITESNRLGDGADTANDLFLNVVGAAVVVALTVLKRKNSNT